ncbi:hypothetical protein GBA52_007719 [Prunus armeniaca]|nr:hypothetical protein GBA52_007719 [Prunus armeniaca]
MDVIGLVRGFFYSGRVFRKLNHTHVVLIPTTNSPRKMSQWRPISLCNVVYKIISKRVIPRVVSLNQSAFVAERQITYNILVVTFPRVGEGVGDHNMAVKIDTAKAYDRALR